MYSCCSAFSSSKQSTYMPFPSCDMSVLSSACVNRTSVGVNTANRTFAFLFIFFNLFFIKTFRLILRFWPQSSWYRRVTPWLQHEDSWCEGKYSRDAFSQIYLEMIVTHAFLPLTICPSETLTIPYNKIWFLLSCLLLFFLFQRKKNNYYNCFL